MPLLILWPPALTQSPTPAGPAKPLSLAEAEIQLTEAFDEGIPLPSLKVAAPNRPALQWLQNAILEARPGNPFPKHTPSFREAAALLKLLDAPPAAWEKQLKELPLTLTGTRMALWRWGRLHMRVGHLDKALRMQWEDRLAQDGVPTLRGLALRHALCWALAESDEARYAELKIRFQTEALIPFSGFQNLFAWLGATSPSFRLWKLPDLTYEDLRLDQIGAARIWICPVETELPQLKAGTAWIIPSQTGQTESQETNPSPQDRSEADALYPRLKAAGIKAWLAPQRREWEAAGLLFFPILIELDAAQQITRIRMGDAAPAQP